MAKQILGLSEVSGSLVVYENVEDVGFEEVVEVKMADGSLRTGRVVEIEGDKIIVQVFEGTMGLSKKNTKTRLLGHPMEIALSKEVLGRTFSGSGRPIDGLGEVYAEKFADINWYL